MRIKDKLIEPYEIEVDPFMYTVFKMGVQEKGNNVGKVAERQIGFYNTLGGAIDRIVKDRVGESEAYVDLKGFVSEHKANYDYFHSELIKLLGNEK